MTDVYKIEKAMNIAVSFLFLLSMMSAMILTIDSISTVIDNPSNGSIIVMLIILIMDAVVFGIIFYSISAFMEDIARMRRRLSWYDRREQYGR